MSATVTGYVPGARAQAAVFDGDDDVVVHGPLGVLGSAEAFTMAFWVRNPVLPDTGTRVLAGVVPNGNEDVQAGLGTDHLYVDIGNGSDAFLRWFDVETATSDGAWHHIAIRFDGSRPEANRVSLFFDGARIPDIVSFNEWPTQTAPSAGTENSPSAASEASTRASSTSSWSTTGR